ncbi:MAG TPA: HigA family addiction module antitoxin [Rudaea sp.]|jgi:addiction module HigA family antidote|uniref:HigA family addiction module antitoxin n=1 Tax=Rudaea sp. TaxID=2136325 RepID=UPI002F92C6F3
MHNPPHPGEILRDDVLPELGFSVTAAAAALGISRVSLSRVLHGHAAISAELAVRLGEWLGNGGGVWLRMQAAYDLWQAERASRPRIAPARKAA